MRQVMNQIESKMNYASNLADLEFNHELEDLFKLASLCSEIEELASSGNTAGPQIKDLFVKKISIFFRERGSFRSEIERFPRAKKLIQEF